MSSSISNQTEYNYSDTCDKCGKMIQPVERLYSRDNGKCKDCEVKAFSAIIQAGFK
jgi:hypothetical protein